MLMRRKVRRSCVMRKGKYDDGVAFRWNLLLLLVAPRQNRIHMHPT